MLKEVPKQEIAKRIQSIRIHKGITQEEMAKLIDVTYSTYAKIENANQNVTVLQLMNISKIACISVDTLLFGEIDLINNLNFEEFINLSTFFSKNNIETLVSNCTTILKLKELNVD